MKVTFETVRKINMDTLRGLLGTVRKFTGSRKPREQALLAFRDSSLSL